MKSFLKFLIAVLVPVVCTWYASTKLAPWLTAVVCAVSCIIMLYIFRAGWLMSLGFNLYRNKAEAGIKVMRLAYKTRKLSPQHQLIYAFVILRNGELDEAETVMNKAITLGKHALNKENFDSVTFNRALITWKKGDLSQAIVQLEELHSTGYSTQALYGSLGSFYLMNKEYDKALVLMQEAIEAKVESPVIYDNLGQAYIGLGRLDDAEIIYNKLIPQKPSFMEAYYNYASIMEIRDKLSEAEYYYKKALTYDETFLSTISTDDVCEAVERVQNISIENVSIEDIVYEGTTETIEFDATEELSDIESVQVDITVPNATNTEEENSNIQ